MQLGREIEGVLSQGVEPSILIEVSGEASRLHMYLLWHTKGTEFSMIMAVGLISTRNLEDLSERFIAEFDNYDFSINVPHFLPL